MATVAKEATQRMVMKNVWASFHTGLTEIIERSEVCSATVTGRWVRPDRFRPEIVWIHTCPVLFKWSAGPPKTRECSPVQVTGKSKMNPSRCDIVSAGLLGGALSHPADPRLEADQRKSPCDVNVHFQAHQEKHANRLAASDYFHCWNVFIVERTSGAWQQKTKGVWLRLISLVRCCCLFIQIMRLRPRWRHHLCWTAHSLQD